MNYELVKQLKSAGFPQKDNGRDTQYLRTDDMETFYIPTLSELIEACGDKLGCLEKESWGEWVAHDSDFTATDGIISELYQRGSIPEEAVANLWLGIQEYETYQQLESDLR